ncbi:hypothetical protein GPJ56_010541 [Histomonas meleagridis]|uniref:uncharacterized protein n=1 Tax=Histomonas meleagridis TaxID=135588 RepID=UPI00355A0290|nr:hypothetical protein GPJ56_010541 [Histomonas meleagridis]KAH0798001.1 hypothetical protein GO595_009220 [Histomonas meleagridis]
MVADPIRFIHACGEILSQDGHHASAYFYALLFIGRSITPNDVVKIESIRNIWMSTDEDQRRSLKDAIFRGLMFPDPTVNNEAIQAFCKLFKIEREFMFPDIDRLLHLIGSPEYNKAIHINGLKVLNEICAESLHNIIGQYGEEVQGVYTRVFNFVGGIFVGLQSSINYNLDICIILCEICTTLIKYAAPLFYPREVFDKFVILVQNYLNMIGNNPTNEQLEFHRNLIQIYTTLTMRFYEYDGFKFIDIGNAILNYLFEETNNGKLLNILDFWIELTKFEMKKVKAIQFKQRYENLLEERQSSIKTSLPHMKDARIHHMRDLILPVLGNLVPRLIQMLTFMREDDQQPEDPNQPTQIYGKAFQVLSNIYEYHPDCVFSEIQKYWSQNNPLASPYPVLHSLLLAIAIISRPPQSPQQGNDVYNYLTRNHLAEALAELYRNILVEGPSNECGHELLEKIPTTFEIISNCLDKFNFTREINVKILRSFAKVIKTVSPILCIEDRDRIMNIFESFLNTPLNLNDKDDGKFAPELYTVVIRGYEALLYTVKPEELDNRKLKKFFINTLVDKISNMTVQSFECLSAILDYFKTYNDVFGTKGNIILNRAKNYQLVLFAYCLSLPGRRKDELNLKQKAKELFEIMKKA